MQFGARLVTGALSGAALAAPAGAWIAGVVAGIIGAIVGTLGGAELRGRLSARGRERFADRVARRCQWPLAAPFSSFRDSRDNQTFRRRNHRYGSGWTVSRWPTGGERPAGSHRRAKIIRRDVRQHRLHADENDGRERLRGTSGAPRGGVWSERRRGSASGHEAGESSPRHDRRGVPREFEIVARNHAQLHRDRRPCALRIRPRDQRRRRSSNGRSHFPQRRGPRFHAARCRASSRSNFSTTAHSWKSTSCPST